MTLTTMIMLHGITKSSGAGPMRRKRIRFNAVLSKIHIVEPLLSFIVFTLFTTEKTFKAVDEIMPPYNDSFSVSY